MAPAVESSIVVEHAVENYGLYRVLLRAPVLKGFYLDGGNSTLVKGLVYQF